MKMLPQAWSDPKVACALLSHMAGLKTGTYKSSGVEGDFFCCSQKKDVGAGFPLPNNLTYHVEGDEQEAHILKLLLNVNNREEPDEAHRELLACSDELSRRALEMPLSPLMREAILDGMPEAYMVKGVTVELKREAWPSPGRGYNLKFVIIRMYM